MKPDPENVDRDQSGKRKRATVEKKKRGQPRKPTPEIVHSDEEKCPICKAVVSWEEMLYSVKTVRPGPTLPVYLCLLRNMQIMDRQRMNGFATVVCLGSPTGSISILQ